MRNFIAAAILILIGGTAQAQYFYQPWVYQRGPNLGGIQYLGNVGPYPVFNPWNMYDNQNYSGYIYARPLFPRRYYTPIYFPPTYQYNFGPYGTYYGYTGITPFQQQFQPQFAGVNPGFGIEREAGRFIPVNNQTAINSITGTVLKPYQGVAYTNEGPFYRLPGTGSLTAFGAFNPATGAYYNPLSGALYNPGTGIIVRR